MLGMNKLPSAKRAEILGLMVEGVSIRAITRLSGLPAKWRNNRQSRARCIMRRKG